MNVTMSLILRPVGVTAAEQFYISEAVALGVADVVETLLTDVSHAEVTVKWPNDIYVGNSKIAGILIENSLSGPDIDWSVAGIGLNVNQPRFTSDAPNPISIAQLLTPGSSTLSIENIISQITDSILNLLNTPPAKLHTLYKNRLWRRNGFHPYHAPELGTFQAQILDIATNGMLTLALPDNTTHTFAFKQVSAIL